MADLIDRENATKLINELLEDIHRGKIELHKQILEQLAINITCLPPADTERHAHWIEYKDITELTLTCNCCGYSYIEADSNCEERYDFCPHCGCKMDEVVAMTKEKAIKTRKFRAMTIGEHCTSEKKKCEDCEYNRNWWYCAYPNLNKVIEKNKPYKTKDGKYILVEVKE